MTFRRSILVLSVVAARDLASLGQPRPTKADFSLLYIEAGRRRGMSTLEIEPASVSVSVRR